MLVVQFSWSKHFFSFPGILGSAVKHLVHQDPELDQGGGGGQDHQVGSTLAVPDRRDQEVILGTGPWQSLIIIIIMIKL